MSSHIADAVVHVIDQPWGVSISDITVEASSDHYLNCRKDSAMTLTGGCYCGDVRYEAGGEPTMRAQCHCRECQYITGGGPNYFLMVPLESLRFTRGEPATFTRDDIPNPVTRLFCQRCGTALGTRLPEFPSAVIKVGTLDHPEQFGDPQMAIFTSDKQPFHLIADGIPQFERTPG